MTESWITSKQLLVKTLELFALEIATDLFLCCFLAEVNKNKRQIWIIATALSITSLEVPIGKKGFQVVVDIRLPDDLAKIEYVFSFQTFGCCPFNQWYICDVYPILLWDFVNRSRVFIAFMKLQAFLHFAADFEDLMKR